MPILTKRNKISQAEPRTLIAASPVSLIVATYVDNNQIQDTRLIARLDNGSMYFLHEDGVDARLRQVSTWLREKIEAELAEELSTPEKVCDGGEDRDIGGPKNG